MTLQTVDDSDHKRIIRHSENVAIGEMGGLNNPLAFHGS